LTEGTIMRLIDDKGEQFLDDCRRTRPAGPFPITQRANARRTPPAKIRWKPLSGASTAGNDALLYSLRRVEEGRPAVLAFNCEANPVVFAG